MTLGYPTRHNVLSGEKSRINLINNGGFTNFAAGLAQVQDTERGAPVLIDQKLYGPVSLSFAPAEGPGQENQLGHWDVYGVVSGVEVSPRSPEGVVYTSYDGGNLVLTQFLDAGIVNFDQEVTNLPGIRGEQLGLSFGGYAFLGTVVVSMIILADGEEVTRVTALSSSFGKYRRVGGSAKIPATAKSVVARIELEGTPGSSVGLSGITVLQGPSGSLSGFVPSIADTSMPSNTVIMYEGEMCPAGYRNVSPGKPVLGLLTSGHAAVMGMSTYTPMAGSDTHDHDPDQPDSQLVATSEARHGHSIPLSGSGTGAFYSTLFNTVLTDAGEVPITLAGVNHAHTLTSNMTAVPPSFPMVFCQKI